MRRRAATPTPRGFALSVSARVSVVVAAVLVVGWSADKPFHIDDPHYLYTARQILKTPLTPYRYSLNWHGWVEPAWDFGMHHPPLLPAYLAPWIAAWGEQERVLHWAMLPLVAAALWGMARLAPVFGVPSVPAVWLLALSPGFMASAGTVMVDVASLGLILLGFSALTRRHEAAAAAWLTLALFTKHAVMPMFLVAGLLAWWRGANLRRLAACLVVGLAAWSAWEFPGLAVVYRADLSGRIFPWYDSWGRAMMLAKLASAPVLLAGAGPVLLAGAWWMRRRGGAALGGGAALAVALLVIREHEDLHAWVRGPGLASRVWFLGATAALAALVIRAAQVPGPRRAATRILLGWLGVTWLGAIAGAPFPAFRFVLPGLPAVILLALGALGTLVGTQRRRATAAVLATTGLLGGAVAYADTAYARAVRTLVDEAVAMSAGHRLFTANHWGVQYYVERAGGTELATGTWPLRRGDRVLVAKLAHAHDVTPPPHARLREVAHLVAAPCLVPVRTIAPERDANLYGGGRYPFAVTRAPLEELTIREVVR